jgi:isopentenyl-diphosphate delta-isomerase
MYAVSRKQQMKELVSRVPPVVNVDVVVMKDWKYLVGRRARGAPDPDEGQWLFPGSRMRFEEEPHETALRVLKNETPGMNAQLKKLVSVLSDKGFDKRAYGVTIYYLFNYLSGEPRPNDQLDDFKWVDKEEFASLPDVHPKDVALLDEVDLAVRTMHTTEDEILVEVDKNDKDTGTVVKRDAHSDKSRYHRAAWIFIFNSSGEVVLQQRGFNKTHNPGLWDMAGGHQIFGSTIEQTAHQELREEMGIDCELRLKKVGLYQSPFQSEFHYVYWGVHDGPYKFDPHEVADIKAFDCERLLAGEYDKDYPIMKHVYEQVEILRSVWEPMKRKVI